MLARNNVECDDLSTLFVKDQALTNEGESSSKLHSLDCRQSLARSQEY